VVKRFLGFVGAGVVVLALGFVGFIWWFLQPNPEPRPLPAGMVSVVTAEGRALLGAAESSADFAPLLENFEEQNLKSYCGVASSVTVLSAMGRDVSQSSFFTDDASRVRSRLTVMLGGMTLTDLADLLRAHDVRVSIRHADSFSVEQFRDVVARNLAQSDDFLLVNYQREVLGQSRVGHISPLAAYDRDSNLVLVMDTASYHYPHSWVPLEGLYKAMATIDSSTGRMRRYLEVTQE
jgi:hypothetical protein